MKPKADYDKLGFAEAVSPGRKQRFFDFTVNRRSLSMLVANEQYQRPSVFGWQDARVERKYAHQLLLRERSSLASGRVPLYVCGECGDLGCGAIAVSVSTLEECVVWTNIGFEGNAFKPKPGPPPEPKGDFSDLRDFYFSRSEYEAALSRFSAGYPMK